MSLKTGLIRSCIFILQLGITASQGSSKNVLFIAVDDLRPEISVYAETATVPPLFPHMHTPNIDDLALKSLVLKRAYVQQPLCAPSRASILTGRRPDTTRVHGFHQNFRQKGGNFTTIPQFFKNKGYNTIGLGKIFHYSPQEAWNDDPISWSEPVWHATLRHEGPNHSWNAISDNQLIDKPLRDQQLTKKAIETIQRIAPEAKAQKRNFFLGVGFYKPHLPFIFPRSMLDFYPESSISIPDPINIQVPFHMPKIAWSDYIFLRSFNDIKAANVSGEFNTLVPGYKMRELRRAYYSTVSFIDSEIGKILTELKNVGLSDNTIVVFWSDHGFHLGENGEWAKHTAFELSNWSPLMIHIPGVTDAGINTYELTEFVDLFPSVVEAAGYRAPPECPINSKDIELCVEGISFIPLISSPDVSLKKAAFSQTVRDNAMGYTMRTKQYRYTEWAKFSEANGKPDWTSIKAKELYDHDTDPLENFNVVNDQKYNRIVNNLSLQLRAGWRNATLINDVTYSYDVTRISRNPSNTVENTHLPLLYQRQCCSLTETMLISCFVTVLTVIMLFLLQFIKRIYRNPRHGNKYSYERSKQTENDAL